MSGGVNRPCFADFKESGKQTLPASSCPHRPTQCRKVSTLETLSGAFTKKDGKAFGNMEHDYGNSSIHERIWSMAKLFCDLVLIGGVF